MFLTYKHVFSSELTGAYDYYIRTTHTGELDILNTKVTAARIHIKNSTSTQPRIIKKRPSPDTPKSYLKILSSTKPNIFEMPAVATTVWAELRSHSPAAVS